MIPTLCKISTLGDAAAVSLCAPVMCVLIAFLRCLMCFVVRTPVDTPYG